MLAKVAHLTQWIEERAPRRLAEDWDNPGLMWGDPRAEVKRVLLAVDGTDAVLAEAAAAGAGLVVLHHPSIWKDVKHLRTDEPLGRRVEFCLKRGIAVYAAHTNYDAALPGMSDSLARRLGLAEAAVLHVTQRDPLLKLVVFVPQGHENGVRDAIAAAGAGLIGNYSHCTFQAAGTGTFLPHEGATPFIGRVGSLERAAEVRLETIVPQSLSHRVVAAMRRAHPYEEPAYDLIPLENEGAARGVGRVGRLAAPVPLVELIDQVKAVCQVNSVRLVGDSHRQVQRVAVCGGDGSDFVRAASRAGAEVLVTGDISHHEALDALDLGLSIIDAGHFGTEWPGMADLADWLGERLQAAGYETRCEFAKAGRDPFQFC
ncbi:MAG: Nif3-like dinuclear metal center hexameric protein [Symbiobacteriia bacterium]